MSIVSDAQVTRGSEAPVSASMVLESRAKNRRVSINQRGSQDLGVLQDRHEKSSNFKPVSRATKIMKIGPKATQNNKECTLE